MHNKLTKVDIQKMQEEIDYREVTLRPKLLEEVKVARAFGDLSENSEYDAAKEEQAQVEAEILEIENKLRFGKIINQKKLDTSKVNVGCYVKLLDLDFNDEFEYQIIGATESDPSKGIISNESPVGQALLGKKVGDIAQVVLQQNNNSVIKLKILEIRA